MSGALTRKVGDFSTWIKEEIERGQQDLLIIGIVQT